VSFKIFKNFFRESERDDVKDELVNVKQNMRRNKTNIAKKLKGLEQIQLNFKKNIINAMKGD